MPEPVFCIPWRSPGTRVRAVIVIIVYLLAFHLSPESGLPLAAGGLLGLWSAIEPSRRPALVTRRA